MAKLKDKENDQLVLDLIYTSESNKNQLTDYVSIIEASKIITKEDNTWYSHIRYFKEKFSGINEEDVTSPKFQAKLNAVSELIADIEKEIRSKLFSIRKTLEELDEGYEVELQQSDNGQINKMIEDLSNQQGREIEKTIIIDEIPKQLIATISKHINDLAKLVAKKEVMQEAKDDAISIGKYIPLEVFKTVSKACEKFGDKYRGEFNINDKEHMKELKAWFKNNVQVLENGEPFYDYDVINGRINTWKSDEMKKTNSRFTLNDKTEL